VNPVRTGVVGVGHLGKEHARIYASMKGVELAGVVDLDAKRARSVARKYKTAFASEIEFLLDKTDAVSIVVPTVGHHAAAMPFLKAGISVLVEKPMSYSVREAEEMVSAAAESGARLQVGHIERFNPGIRAIAGHGLNPLFIEAHRLSPFPFRATDVGVVFDLMIHDLDIVQTLVPSPIERIDAIGVSVISSHEDIANARITFRNGCVANLTASRISLKKLRKVRIFGADSYTTIDTGERKAIVYRKKTGFDEVARQLRGQSAMKTLLKIGTFDYADLVAIENVHLDKKEPLRAELESFVRCVSENTAPEVPGEDGVAAVRTAEAIVKQIREKIERTDRTLPT